MVTTIALAFEGTGSVDLAAFAYATAAGFGAVAAWVFFSLSFEGDFAAEFFASGATGVGFDLAPLAGLDFAASLSFSDFVDSDFFDFGMIFRSL